MVLKKRGLLVMILSVFLTACEPRLLSISIHEYPDKILYVVGQDAELDLTGLVLYYAAGEWSGIYKRLPR